MRIWVIEYLFKDGWEPIPDERWYFDEVKAKAMIARVSTEQNQYRTVPYVREVNHAD